MGDHVSGLSTDLIKAFNDLARVSVLGVAAWIGLPRNMLRPWTGFLSRTCRRFRIHQSVSAEVMSTSGFSEGDPMSPIAMILSDWVFHRYLQIYSPSIRSLSFVDNLAFLASTPGHLMHGYALTSCFCEMLDLDLDLGKTFVWSTSTRDRKSLQGLDLHVATEARELRGILFIHACMHAFMHACIHLFVSICICIHAY